MDITREQALQIAKQILEQAERERWSSQNVRQNVEFKQYIDPQDMVDFLNDILERDPDALRSLIEHRVPCNEMLGEHPTVQCGLRNDHITVGILGILNGLCGVNKPNKWGYVSAVVEENGTIYKFEVLRE